MKYLKLKFLLMFFALAMAIPPAWAEEVTVTKTVQELVNQYGWTLSSGSNIGTLATNFDLDDVVNISTTGGPNCGSIWSGPQWRLYQNQNGNLIVTVKSGYTLKSVKFTYTVKNTGTLIGAPTSNEEVTVSGSSVTFPVGNTGEATNGQVSISKFTVTYETGGSSLTPVTLEFPESNYTAFWGQSFTAPELTVDPSAAASEVTYSSSDESVATVDASGNVTPVAIGTTTITASISNSETYNNATASYTLTVKPDPNVVAVLDFTNSNLWNPSLPIDNASITEGPVLYNDGTYEVTIAGNPGFYYYSNAHDLLLGKKDAYLQFPAFSKPVERIVIEGAPSNISASGKVTQNIFVGNTAVSTETTSAKENHTYQIAPGYQSAGTIYTLRVTNDNNTQFQKIYIYFKEETGEPELTLTPPELNIGEAGGSLFVNGSNLGSDPGVFLINETGYSDQFDFALQGVDEGQTWFPRTNGAVTNGKVDVTYTGHELIAQGKIGVNSNNTGNGASSIVYYKVDDIYIVGDYGINEGWNFTDGTNRMSNNGGVFTYELNVNNTNTFIAFAKKVGEGVGFNTPSVFTPSSGGNWEMDADTKSGTINVYGAQPIHFQYAGLYAIEINTNNNPATFTITRTLPQVAKPKISPNGGNFAASQTVALSCDTEDASIYYTTDESEPSAENGTLYEGEIMLNATTTLKAIAVKGGMRPSEVATATFTKTGIDDLAGVIALGKNKNFTFVGNVVVTYVGTYGNHTLIGLRDVSENKADGKGGGVFYDPTSTTPLEAGNTLAPEWTGTTYQYGNSWIEIINANNITVNGTGVEVLPFDRTGVELTSANQSEYIILRNVTIDAEAKTATWSDDSKNTITYELYNRFDGVTYDSGNYKYLIGLVSAYKASLQVYPIDLKKAQQDPELAFDEETPATVYVGDEITLTVNNVPEGAELSFTCDPEDAVTFGENGKATFKTAGNVTITAHTTATDEYTAGTATCTITVEARPFLLADEAVELETTVGTHVSDTFDVAGENLKGDITLTLNDTKGVFTIDPTSIAKADAEGTITVTYTPKDEAVDEATITIKSKDAEDVTVSLTGMATLPDPVLTVSTETLEMGTKPSDTFTVTGQHLTENVTLTVTEGTAANFEISPATIIPDEEGKVSQEVTVTYKGNSTEDEYATITVKSGIAKKKVIVTARVLPTPVIVIDEETLDLGTTGEGTFDIMAEDLRGNITLTCDNENFTVSPTTITPDEAEEGVTITVTYTGNNTEVETATITITTDGIDPITKTVTAKAETYVDLAKPTFSPAAGTYTEPKEVAIACATPGVTIMYTMDGVTKTYEGPFLVDHSCTVTATASKGSKVAYNDSEASAQYTINAAAAAAIADDYYYMQNNELSSQYANVAGRRTLNFVGDPDQKAGTVFRVETGNDGAVKTLRSQAVDLQGYANRAMAYVPKVIDLVLSTLANSSLGDPETPGEGILGENGVQLILKKFYEKFDYNLYVEQAEGGYRIYGRTPSMQHVVDFYHENTAQVEEKLPMLEGYINQVLDKIRNKVGQAGMNEGAIPEFSLKTVRDSIAKKNGIALIDPVDNDSKMEFYRQVLNNKEYVWDFAYQTAMIYVDAIKQTGTYQNLPNEYKLYVEKMEKVRPDTKYYIIERGNELDYISENNGEIISNDPRTFWKLTKRENFTVNVPEANKLNDSYYTTLYTDFGYELPTGVNAYAVTGIDENDVAQLTEITGVIPAQTPVLLKADAAGDKELTLKTDSRGGAIEGNLLEGPDYLIKTYGITSPTVEMLFNMAAGFVPAETLADYEYLKLRTSGTVNNKYMWALSKEEIYKCGTPNEYDQVTETVIRRLATNEGTLAFSDQWNIETNKAFLVSETKPVIYLEKETLAAPTFSPVPGSYTVENGQNVSITISAEDDATISYSTDGGKTWNTYSGPITASDDMTIVAKAEKEGMIASNEVTAVYVIDNPTELPDVPAMKGYYQIKNNGNSKYANVAGRKTLNFVEDPTDKAGTVIWLETNGKGQVQSIRSQAADLQRYADRAMTYVPDIVEIVADKLNADGVGNLLGHEGLEKIMDKFNESFDHHLYVEQAEGGYRLYGKTPSMQPVVEFYRENQAKVEAKLPMLEQFINDALDKLKEKLGGQSVFTKFELHDIWQKMGGNLPEPVVGNDAAIMDFYRAVLNNKNYVWDFAYQTAMIYVNNLTSHPRWEEIEGYLGEYAQYINMIEQVRPDFKYYVVQKNDKPDFISEGNTDIINNIDRTIWTLEPRTTFNVSIADNIFGCPYADGIGGYATTLYTDFAYSVPESVTAYKVTSIKGGKATVKRLSGIIPAQTPVLLTAKETGVKELMLNPEGDIADMSGNLLYGPDYLINEYDINTTQVQELFDKIKEKLGQDFYDTYVAQYEHLADLNSGTVNNKYFWGLKQEDVLKCGTTDEYDRVQCVVRSLEDGKFVNNLKVETNKAFLVNSEFDPITINSLRGDVNHDGAVNIQDVTDLIDYLLETNFAACPYCSDFNEDTGVNIQDVTDLIDFLLENPETTEVEPETGD